MSESWPTVALLTFSGGLQDAYSYCVRGKVFANAQTGNIVLMSQCFLPETGWAGFTIWCRCSRLHSVYSSLSRSVHAMRLFALCTGAS